MTESAMIDVDEAEKAAQEASEHLLICHANTDKGALDLPNQVVHRDSFTSPCTQPHVCWNRLEVAIRALRSAAERDRDELWCRALVNLGDTRQMERVTAEVNRLRSLAAKETSDGD